MDRNRERIDLIKEVYSKTEYPKSPDSSHTFSLSFAILHNVSMKVFLIVFSQFQRWLF